MFGAIFGDILGSVYEFDPVSREASDFPLFKKGQHLTDDSILTLGTADALMKLRKLGIKRLNASSISDSGSGAGGSDGSGSGAGGKGNGTTATAPNFIKLNNKLGSGDSSTDVASSNSQSFHSGNASGVGTKNNRIGCVSVECRNSRGGDSGASDSGASGNDGTDTATTNLNNTTVKNSSSSNPCTGDDGETDSTVTTPLSITELNSLWSDTLSDDEIKRQFVRSYLEVVSLVKDTRELAFGTRFWEWLQSPDPQPYNSWGNGSAMRVSPIGDFMKSEKEVLRFAKLSSEISHNHPEAIAAAQAVALAGFWAKSEVPRAEIRQRLEKQFKYDLSRKYSEVQRTSEYSERASVSAPDAIVCFLTSENFEDAITKAIALRADADTQAAIAGGISENFYRSFSEKTVTYCMPILTANPKLEHIVRDWQSDEQNSRFLHPGDGFIECQFCHRKHWGKNGGAGILIARIAPTQTAKPPAATGPAAEQQTASTANAPATKLQVTHVLMQLRSLSVTHGGTWGIPGGALADGETDLEGALREAQEEADIKPEQIEIVDQIIRDHQNWHFTTILAIEKPGVKIEPHNLDQEAIATRWVEVSEIPKLQLLHHFENELEDLTEKLLALKTDF